MKALDINNRLTDSYLALLKNLSPSNKLDLIAKLTQSVKADMETNDKTFSKSFGAWEGKEDANELVNQIKSSRSFTRKIEEL